MCFVMVCNDNKVSWKEGKGGGRVRETWIVKKNKADEREKEIKGESVCVRDGDCNQELLVENKMAAYYVHSLNTHSL